MVSLEQVQETYCVEVKDRSYSLISTYNANQDTNDIDIMLEGIPVPEGSKEYEEVLKVFKEEYEDMNDSL